MLNIIEKTFGRTILVDVVDGKTGLTPLGFDTHSPYISWVRMDHGKFGVRIKGSEPVDVVVRLDNKVIAQRQLEGGVVHTITRTDDGKPFYFTEKGTKPQHVSDDAGQPIDGAQRHSEEPAEQTMLFPELEAADERYAESHGLLIVQVRFSHVKPDFGPQYAPDDFSNVLFQLNPKADHARALAKNFSKVVRPEPLPEGKNEFGGDVQPGIPRNCCVACDRDHNH